MERRSQLLLSFTTVWLASCSMGYAQLVRVYPGGGVSVRAPFVRVEVDAFGGTYVRAPFTSVYSPGDYYAYPYADPYGAYSPAYGASPDYGLAGSQAGTIPEDLLTMDWQPLREITSSTAGELESQLDGFATGGSWKSYLQPGRIQDLLASRDATPPTLATQQQFRVILSAFDTVAGDPAYQSIASLTSFTLLHAAVAEIAHPLEHQRRLLAASAAALEESLQQWPTGAMWRGYLELPPELVSSDLSEVGEATALIDTLHRFDRVQESSEYSQIAALPAFQEVCRQLADYVWLLQEQPEDSRPLEELPAPTESIELNAPAR